MTENPYRSPEETEEGETPESDAAYLRGLESLRAGIGWVLTGGAAAVVMMLMFPVPVLQVYLEHFGGVMAMVGAVTTALVAVQVYGMWRCMRCPGRIARNVDALVGASMGLMVAAYFAAWTLVWGKSLETVMYGLALACLLPWLWFLMRVARGLKRPELTVIAAIVAGLWLAVLVLALLGEQELLVMAGVGYVIFYLSLMMALRTWLNEEIGKCMRTFTLRRQR